MLRDKVAPGQLAKLRRSAESVLTHHATAVGPLTPAETNRLVHELQVHQIELEMQNNELRRTQSELEQARDRYAHLYEISPLACLTIRADGLVCEANPMAVALLGLTRDRLVGVALSRFISSKSQTAYYLHVRQVLKSREMEVCDLNLSLADGSLVLVRLHSILDQGSDDSDSQWITQVQNRTDQVLVGEAPVGIFRADLAGAFRYVNPQWSAMTGASLEELLGNRWLCTLHPEDRDRVCDAWAITVTEQIPFRAEFRLVNPRNGRVIWVLGQSSRELDAKAVLRGFVGTITDITELKEAQERLKKSEALLSNVKEHVENQERQRLASTIHDGAIQALQAVLLRTKAITLALQGEPLLRPEGLVATNRQITEVINQLRDLSTDLHPAFLDRMDLVEAVRWKCNKLAKSSHIALHVDVEGNLGPMGSRQKRNAYLIFQEAISNAMKHAECNRIDILLQETSTTSFCMQISDNGHGFDWETTKKNLNGIGLAIIQERTARVGGTVHFLSTPGQGTSILVRMPCHD
ncbi:MAG: PAS domain S-box protein [Magnetococcales bacterium]|nr:PAS domain S-box protein [Magnetococcales bacterium]